MENLILIAQEDWDDRLNFYRPCGVSPTWYDDSISHTICTLGDYLTNDLLSKDYKTIKMHINRNIENSKYIYKKELYKKKYFYIINIYNPMFFIENKDVGFKYIDNNILNDVINNNCKIILIQDVEGYSCMKNTQHEFELNIIDIWCDKVGIPYRNVYYITGNLIADKIANEQNIKTNIIPITVQENWNNIFNFNDIELVPRFIPNDYKYLFLSYSRRPRQHRALFVAKILKEKLSECGKWSFNYLDQKPDYNNKIYNDVIPQIKKLYEKSPFLIDNKPNDNDEITTYIPFNEYESTFINIVGETLYENGTLFISEKTWKPIIVGVPFMIIGSVGTLKYLKKEGFKTFDKWVDESYDDKNDINERIDIIINELKRFKDMNIIELIKIRNEMREICIFNNNLMKIRTKNKFYINDIYINNKPTSDIINKIWLEWKDVKFI